MAAAVAAACDFPRGAGFFMSLFKKIGFQPTVPVQLERGNVAKENKYATKIFRNF
jgi:hypothetical protein